MLMQLSKYHMHDDVDIVTIIALLVDRSIQSWTLSRKAWDVLPNAASDTIVDFRTSCIKWILFMMCVTSNCISILRIYKLL